MKRSAILILIGALALPAPALAQNVAPVAPVGKAKAKKAGNWTKWNLKDSEVKTAKAGPPVPAPQRLRLPAAKSTRRAAATPEKKPRVNAGPLVASVIKAQRDKN